ncbi:MAG: hypothetical protein RLZZ617_79, partial [Bacteroidota bacterium]
MWKGKEDFPNGIPQVAFVTDWEDGEAQATRLLALEELGVNYVFLHLVGPSRAQASADWGLEGVGQVSGLQWVAWNAWPDALES